MKTSIQKIFLICLIAHTIFAYDDDAKVKSEAIKKITGYQHDWYSYYFNVTSDGEQQIKYFFFPSQSDPKTDPLVLWLNGNFSIYKIYILILENQISKI